MAYWSIRGRSLTQIGKIKMADTKHLTLLVRIFDILDPTNQYSWEIIHTQECDEEYLTIQLFNNSIIKAFLPIEDALKLLEDRFLQLEKAKELFEKFKKAKAKIEKESALKYAQESV